MNNPYRFGEKSINNISPLNNADVKQAAELYGIVAKGLDTVASGLIKLKKDSELVQADKAVQEAKFQINELSQSGTMGGRELIQYASDNILPELLEGASGVAGGVISKGVMRLAIDAGIQVDNARVKAAEKVNREHKQGQYDGQELAVLNSITKDSDTAEITKGLNQYRKETLDWKNDKENDILDIDTALKVEVYRGLQDTDGLSRLMADGRTTIPTLQVLDEKNKYDRILENQRKQIKDAGVQQQFRDFVSGLVIQSDKEEITNEERVSDSEKLSEEIRYAEFSGQTDYAKSLKTYGQTSGLFDRPLTSPETRELFARGYNGNMFTESEIDYEYSQGAITASEADAIRRGLKARDNQNFAAQRRAKSTVEYSTGLTMASAEGSALTILLQGSTGGGLDNRLYREFNTMINIFDHENQGLDPLSYEQGLQPLVKGLIDKFKVLKANSQAKKTFEGN